MHGHQGQVLLRGHQPALEEKPVRGGPGQMQAHQEGQDHADEHREQRQAKILDADHFVIDAEHVFPNETGRRVMLLVTAAVFVCHH